MQIGDKVQLVTGTVRDLVKDSVLVAIEADGHEYWFKAAHLTVVEPPAAAAAAEAGPTPAKADQSKKPAAAPAPKEQGLPSEQPGFTDKTKEELIAYGKKYGLNMSDRSTKQELIDQIDEAYTEQIDEATSSKAPASGH